MSKTIRAIGAVIVVGLWLTIAGLAWFSSDEIYSFSERSYLISFRSCPLRTFWKKTTVKEALRLL